MEADMTTDLTAITTDLAPVLADAGPDIRIVRDGTGSVAIVLDAVAADRLTAFLFDLGAFHDVAGDDADDDRLAAADVISTIRDLLARG
jgi:hypothetical protein